MAGGSTFSRATWATHWSDVCVGVVLIRPADLNAPAFALGVRVALLRDRHLLGFRRVGLFVVKGADEGAVRALLADAGVRHALSRCAAAQPELAIADGEAFVETRGQIRDPARLSQAPQTVTGAVLALETAAVAPTLRQHVAAATTQRWLLQRSGARVFAAVMMFPVGLGAIVLVGSFVRGWLALAAIAISALVIALDRHATCLVRGHHQRQCVAQRPRAQADKDVMNTDMILNDSGIIVVSDPPWEHLKRIEKLERDNCVLRQQIEQLSAYRQLAYRDELTGLYNRRSFDERLAQELNRAHRNGCTLAVVEIDIDDFKLINDTCGHPCGDEVLRFIGGLMASTCRLCDVAARVGGDELAFILPDTDADGAEALVARLFVKLSIAASRPVLPRGLGIELSYGIAATGSGAETPEALVASADTAMYECKQITKLAAAATVCPPNDDAPAAA